MKILLTFLVATAFLWHLTDDPIRAERQPTVEWEGRGWQITGRVTTPTPASSIPYFSLSQMQVIATDSVEYERLSLGGGTEETVTYTYVTVLAYDSLYKRIFLDSTEMVEYNRVHKSKFR